MKRPVALALIGALSLAGAACKESGTTVSNNVSGSTNQTDEPGVANLGANAAPGGMQMNPQQFAETAAGSDLFEIESGKLAHRMGSSASVKSMGGTLVDEHTKSSRELKAAAAKVPGVALPVVPPPELQAKLDGLKGLKGQAFDRQFITDQIAAHRQSLTLDRDTAIDSWDELTRGDDPTR